LPGCRLTELHSLEGGLPVLTACYSCMVAAALLLLWERPHAAPDAPRRLLRARRSAARPAPLAGGRPSRPRGGKIPAQAGRRDDLDSRRRQRMRAVSGRARSGPRQPRRSRLDFVREWIEGQKNFFKNNVRNFEGARRRFHVKSKSDKSGSRNSRFSSCSLSARVPREIFQRVSMKSTIDNPRWSTVSGVQSPNCATAISL
jgi:hypothetical protein